MPTPKKGARLGAGPAHQRLMLAGMASQLFEHGRITTTEAKARALRPVAEKLITKAKKADLGTVESLHQRRQVLRSVRDKSVVHALFEEIAPRFAERPGGYTRITKIGPRKGDNAPMAVIELVTEDYAPTARATKPAAAAAAPAPAVEEAPAEETTATDEAPADGSGEAEQAAAEAEQAAEKAEQAADKAEDAAEEAEEAAAEADEAAAKAEQAAEKAESEDDTKA